MHENLSINQKIYEFRIRNEELSRRRAGAEPGLELELELENFECLSELYSSRPCPSLGRGLDAFKTKTNNINFKTLRCISN